MRLNILTGVSPAPARSRNGLPRGRVQVQSDTQPAYEPLVPQRRTGSMEGGREWEGGGGFVGMLGEGSKARHVVGDRFV